MVDWEPEEIEAAWTMANSDDVPDSEPSTSEINSRVRVLQTPRAFVVELAFAREGSTEFKPSRYLTPGEARQLRKQLAEDDSPLAAALDEQETERLRMALEMAADYAGTMSIGEMVGHDVIEAYKKDQITEEEFMHEFSREVDKELEKRDE